MSTSLTSISEKRSVVHADVPQMNASPWQRLCRKLLEATLSQLQFGALTLREGSRVRTFGEAVEGLNATIEVHDASFYPAAAFFGSVGAGRSYMQGAWSSSNLTEVVQILSRNQVVLQRWSRGPASMIAPVLRAAHWLRRNTLHGSRRNIEAHYDLSNELFEQFLDPSMMYSCAYFESPGVTLEQASRAKLERICHKLRLQPEDHVLEIGTGWGGLAIYAARNFGCRVTTTTISREQYDYAVARVRAAGLGDRVQVLLQDYRELTGTYDKIVSIEMIEAVGAEYLNTYLATCNKLLAEDGAMMLQAIVIDDRRYEQAVGSVDFIKRYIFPGSFIPSVHRIDQALREVTDLDCVHSEDITSHYAETLLRWKNNFQSNRDQIGRLGFDSEFQRMWEFYFAYCEGGFRERRIGNVQLLLTKPDWLGSIPSEYPSFEGMRWTSCF